MIASINTVVFDLGGVLIEWDPEHLYRRLIPDDTERADFLTHVCTREWHERHDAGASFASNAQDLFLKYADNPRIQGLIKAWGNRFDEMIVDSLQGTQKILHDLHGAGTRLYALTNWPAEAFGAARRRFSFLSLFQDIVVSGDEGIKKPDRAIYEILLKRTSINPAQTIYIDDRAENLVPAADLGMTPILFTTPENLAVELRRFSLLPL